MIRSIDLAQPPVLLEQTTHLSRHQASSRPLPTRNADAMKLVKRRTSMPAGADLAQREPSVPPVRGSQAPVTAYYDAYGSELSPVTSSHASGYPLAQPHYSNCVAGPSTVRNHYITKPASYRYNNPPVAFVDPLDDGYAERRKEARQSWRGGRKAGEHGQGMEGAGAGERAGRRASLQGSRVDGGSPRQYHL